MADFPDLPAGKGYPLVDLTTYEFGAPIEARLFATIEAAVEASAGGVRVNLFTGDNINTARPDAPFVSWGSQIGLPNNIDLDRDEYRIISTTPAPWSPAMLDLIGWYDASDMVHGATGAIVTTIPDKSGHGRDLGSKAGTGDITISVSAMPGARRSFAFPLGPYVTSPVFAPGTWTHPVTVFMAVRTYSAGATQTFFDGGGTGSASLRAGIYRSSTSALGITQGTTLTSAAAAVPSAAMLLAVDFNGDATSQAVIGSTVVSGPATAGAGIPPSIRLGAAWNAANPANVSFGEVIVARSVGSSARSEVLAYLTAKWGL